MKTTFAFFLTLLVLFSTHNASAANDRLGDLQLSIVQVSHSGSITVRMTNMSRRLSLRIWMERNSWGMLKWKVLIIRNETVRTVFQDPDGVGFTKNTPQFEEIPPRGHVDRKLDINDVYHGYWSTVGTQRFILSHGTN
jgi:hypothetical protein